MSAPKQAAVKRVLANYSEQQMLEASATKYGVTTDKVRAAMVAAELSLKCGAFGAKRLPGETHEDAVAREAASFLDAISLHGARR